MSNDVQASKEISLLTRLRSQTSNLLAAAVDDDRSEGFPDHAFRIISQAGCLEAVLPPQRQGVGLGWAANSNKLLFALLRAIGGVHLSAARLFEGHVNAFQLLWTYGDASQRDALCAYVEEGELLGVWNAPSPDGDMLLIDSDRGFLLQGTKAYASGAGNISRPLVTARHPSRGLLMIWPNTAYTVGPASEWSMHGMRSSYTRSVNFDCLVERGSVFGEADDYHRQPDFSGGAWRFLAAQLGAGEALAEMMRTHLLLRGRSHDTHQRARMAQCDIVIETARKWILDSMQRVSTTGASVEMVVQHANAARLVVERSLLDVMELVHRGVGLQSFSRDSPFERVSRDLATYLRQPAPDSLVESIGARAFLMLRQGLLGGLFDEEQLG
ncbi:MAG: acyl-CoA dehydrogenase [Pseudomonadota bacterium]|nr:acyl-CoA dehydrogenase [Pseudomonadota bacterium]